MTIHLEGQIILVTGASRGIGAALARALAGAGATVAVHYGRSGAEALALAEAIGQDSAAFQADLAQPAAVDALYQAVIARYGRLDVLINNAGIAQSQAEGASPEAWLQAWQTTLQVNLIAAARLCHLALPQMQQQGQGRFIHIASRAAFRGDTPAYLAYAASKGGMVALSRSLARGYGKQGIKSFLLAPGFVETEMAQSFIDQYGRGFVLDDLALPALTQPEDLAPTVLLMASGHMDHATGCTVDLNAGSYVH
jgi:NAD(P)-dependent dehydrogenase (short-subunit alcohol dehydrogenase family)